MTRNSRLIGYYGYPYTAALHAPRLPLTTERLHNNSNVYIYITLYETYRIQNTHYGNGERQNIIYNAVTASSSSWWLRHLSRLLRLRIGTAHARLSITIFSCPFHACIRDTLCTRTCIFYRLHVSFCRSNFGRITARACVCVCGFSGDLCWFEDIACGSVRDNRAFSSAQRPKSCCAQRRTLTHAWSRSVLSPSNCRRSSTIERAGGGRSGEEIRPGLKIRSDDPAETSLKFRIKAYFAWTILWADMRFDLNVWDRFTALHSDRNAAHMYPKRLERS